jgi:hypothetical protein
MLMYPRGAVATASRHRSALEVDEPFVFTRLFEYGALSSASEWSARGEDSS